jgi:6-pyruvoyltetrahydropterin/6-carboxytetrahydropterin synthase
MGSGGAADGDAVRIVLSQRFSFEAAHRLENRPICVEEGERMHGHSYFVEIALCGDLSLGMVMDSSLLKVLGEKIIYRLDHRFLNDIIEMGVPTIENIAAFILRESIKVVSANIAWVKVWRPSVGDCATIYAKAYCKNGESV